MKPKTITFLLIFAVLFLAAAGFLPCGVRQLIGVPCPMCGITRAYLCAIEGNFYRAMCYHPLFMLLPVIILLLVIIKNKIVRRVVLILAIIVFLAAYIIRMVTMFPSKPPMDFYDGAVFIQLFERIFEK